MKKAGTGFARRVTVLNIEQFRPLLRARPAGGGKRRGDGTGDGPVDPAVAAAQALFGGTSVRVRFPFTPVDGTAKGASPGKANAERDTHQIRDAAGSKKVTPGWDLVWKCDGLTRRDLSLPKGASSHATGQIGLRKGAFPHINRHRYFRHEVFGALTWTRGPLAPHLWQAVGQFEMVVRGRSHGFYELTLHHNADRKSKTYKTANPTTHLSWGDAKAIVSKPSLLRAPLRLYRSTRHGTPRFRIEIDGPPGAG